MAEGVGFESLGEFVDGVGTLMVRYYLGMIPSVVSETSVITQGRAGIGSTWSRPNGSVPLSATGSSVAAAVAPGHLLRPGYPERP